MAFKHVVFDIDDTLYLERDYVLSGFLAVEKWLRQELGAIDFAAAAWQEFLHGRRGTIFNHVLQQSGLSEALVPELVRVYRAHSPQISLLPDAMDCLNQIAKRQRIAVLTDGPLESQRAKVRALKIFDWASDIVFTDELGIEFRKPHPKGFKLLQADFRGDDCVYVADNPSKDFAAPKSLGWCCIRILRKNSLHEDLKSGSDVDFEFNNLTEALPAL